MSSGVPEVPEGARGDQGNGGRDVEWEPRQPRAMARIYSSETNSLNGFIWDSLMLFDGGETSAGQASVPARS